MAKGRDPTKLTPKQEKFVQGLISGLSQREAYKQSYSCNRMSDNAIDREASILFKNPKITQRYEELLQEHKEKALWTREEAVNDLIWVKEKAKSDINSKGIRQANSSIFLNAIKELNTLEDLYPKEDKKDNNTTENKIADVLEDLVNGFK